MVATLNSSWILSSFEKFELVQISRLENIHANALSKLASGKDFELFRLVSIEHITRPLIVEREEVMRIDGTP